jgi:glycosyltransferase involved in cell wall biosynthesis
LLCIPGDPACLANKICALIEHPALRLRLGRAARRSFEQGAFHPASVCERFISIYHETIQREQFSQGDNKVPVFSLDD